jgi:hypothetical protein
MISWELRPAEVAYFYNPAYIGRLLKELVASYQAEKSEGISYELIIIALPKVISKSVRQALPNTIRTQFHYWIQENSDFKVYYASFVKELIPFIKESLIFLLRRDILTINERGKIVTGSTRLKKTHVKDTDDIKESIKKAAFVGKWLARAGEISTIYALWGIRP